jgi:hypothetical protein
MWKTSLHPVRVLSSIVLFALVAVGGVAFAAKPGPVDGPVKVRSSGIGTGVLLNDGVGGEIYGGRRWPRDADGDWMTLRMGATGVRVANPDNTTEPLAIDRHGGIYLNGDVFVNGKKMFVRSEGAWTGNSKIVAVLTVANVLLVLTGMAFWGYAIRAWRRKRSD